MSTRRAGVPVECTHVRARHEHGSRTTYILDRCRCYPCSAASSAYDAARRGGTAPRREYTDAAPVRAHLLMLTDAGMTRRSIALAAHVSERSVRALWNGTTLHATVANAEALLAVRVPARTVRADARVPGFGARRRLRALVAAGYAPSSVAAALNVSGIALHTLLLTDTPMPAARDHSIRDLYAAWAEIAPRGAAADAQPKARAATLQARTLAATHGWVPPAGWEQEDLDDPTAEPKHALRNTELDGADGPVGVDLDDVEWLLDGGVIPTEVARRMGISLDGLQLACRRGERADLAQRLSRNAARAA